MCTIASAVSRKEEYRDTLVEQGATLGAGARSFAEHELVTMPSSVGAVVNRDVKPFALMVGVPGNTSVG